MRQRNGLCALPKELLEFVFDRLQPKDLCALALVGSKLLGDLADAPSRWQACFEDEHGPANRLQLHAAAASSWKRLFVHKRQEATASHPWRKACSAELDACVELMVVAQQQATEGACRPETACVLLLDGSGSVGADEFAVMSDFVVSTVRKLQALCQVFKVGVVQFSNDVREEAPLKAVEDVEAFAASMQQMVRMNGGTNICAALQRAGQLLKQGAAPDAHRLVLLLTDGRVDSHQASEAAAMAERLADEQANVAVHAFGVGRGVDEPELVRIVEGACGGGSEGAALASERYVELFVRDEAPW